jgi:transcriptional regulator with XRE-family HTH domain
VTTPGTLLRKRRRAHGLTQAQLARRVGTSQAAISRIERDELSPTFETLTGILLALGERPELDVRRLPADHDRRRLAQALALSPQQRLERAFAWDRFAGEVAEAGARARRS